VERNLSNSNYDWRLYAEFNLSGEPRSEELAGDGARIVAECVSQLHLPDTRLERVKTAVKEAVTNVSRRVAPEKPPLPLEIRVFVPEGRITTGHPGDEHSGYTGSSTETTRETPPVASGWGFFLIEKVADGANINVSMDRFNGLEPPFEALHHTIDVFLYLEGESDW
jgi:anti-sigma regulatory factor (Ser/Thr protein kinase)